MRTKRKSNNAVIYPNQTETVSWKPFYGRSRHGKLLGLVSIVQFIAYLYIIIIIIMFNRIPRIR